MMRGENIICISSIDWDFNWQGHQEIMSAFAAAGNQVLFIENTGVRTPTWRDWPRLQKRLANGLGNEQGFRQVQERLWVYSPLLLPFPFLQMVHGWNRRILEGAIRKWLRMVNGSHPILWIFLPTQLAVDLMDRIPHSLAVYYCIADFGKLAQRPEQLLRSERELIQKSDLVFAQGEDLRKKAAPLNPNTHIFPFGVQWSTFERFRGNNRHELPEDIRHLKKPLIGYVGGLHRHIDFEILREMARRQPQWSLVLIGPRLTDLSYLTGIDNVVLLGEKKFGDLPAYIDAFDVCLIPYVISSYTMTVYPTKLNEYLAMGKPVVSTALPEVTAYNERYGSLVSIAQEPAQWVEKVEEALMEKDPDLVKRRLAAAQDNSWENRIEQMSRLMEGQPCPV